MIIILRDSMSFFEQHIELEKIVQRPFNQHNFLNDLSQYRHHVGDVETLEPNDDFEINNDNSRFFRITELSAQEQFNLRQDLENVIACMRDVNFNWVYYISGTETGIEIYIGLVLLLEQGDVFHQKKLLESQLLGNISGILLEEVSSQKLKTQLLNPLHQAQHFGLLTGIPSLTLDPQAQSKGIPIHQGIDRLARSLTGETWQMLLVAQPERLQDIDQYIDEILNLATDLHPHVKHAIQITDNHSQTTTQSTSTATTHNTSTQSGSSDAKSSQWNKTKTEVDQWSETGGESSSSTKNQTSTSSTTEGRNKSVTKGNSSNNSESETKNDTFTKTKGDSHSKGESKTQSEGNSNAHTQAKHQSYEHVEKKYEHIQKYVWEKLLHRFELGRSKGLFKTAIYLSAYNKRTYESLVLAVQSIFQGNQSLYSPLHVQKLHLKQKNISELFRIQWKQSKLQAQSLLVQSTPHQTSKRALATWLNASELSILAGLPSREVCGIRLRKNVDFASNPILSSHEHAFELGNIIQNGRELEKSKVLLDKALLNQHIFISGVTGAGKTTTCQQILVKSGLPFLVIEPAKTEYRGLYELVPEIEFYTLNNEQVSPFRINPFELLPNQQLVGHIDMLKATFAAVFPMEASMPYLIEEAIVRSYESKGWDVHTSRNFLFENPFQADGQAFPIMSEMLEQLKRVIKSKNFGDELQQKYEGSLISRLDNLTIGSKGRMLNTRVSIDVCSLLDQKVVIELEELKDEQDKALMMGLLIGRVAEAVKQRYREDSHFQHLTLIEEAHRLLEKPQGYEDGAKKLGVNLFANLLAEVRKYGEGLVIADQIPNKLAPEVLKNTNTKIIHRLFAADDRQAIGETIGLSEEQIKFLPMLTAGEAVVYSAGWHEAVRTKVGQQYNTNASPIAVEIIATRSQARIYEQRHQLYPRLSVLVDLAKLDAKTMHELISEGSFLLNLWLKWYHALAYDPHQHKQIIIQRLIKDMEQFEQRWEALDPQTALAKLCLDIAPIAYLEAQHSSLYTVETCLSLLFGLAQRQKLQEPLRSDLIFEKDTGRTIITILEQVLQPLHTI